MRQYATIAEFAASPFSEDDEGETITVTDKQLRRASLDIDGLTIAASYRVDDDGEPIDQAILEAFRDATCAQAAWYQATGDASGAGAAAGPITLGPLSVGGRRGTAGGGSAPADSRYSPEALQILRNAGLRSTAVAHG